MNIAVGCILELEVEVLINMSRLFAINYSHPWVNAIGVAAERLRWAKFARFFGI